MIPIDEDNDVPISEVSNESANDSSDGEGAGEAENEEGSQSKKFLNYKPTTKMPRRRTAKPVRSQSFTRSSLSDTTSSESFQHQERENEHIALSWCYGENCLLNNGNFLFFLLACV